MRYNHIDMLPENAFKPRPTGGMTLESSSSPAPSGPTTSTVTNTNIPDYAKPYVETMLGATQQQLFNTTTNPDGSTQITGVKPFQPYSQNPSDYVAGFSPLQQQSFGNTQNLQVPGQIGQASNLTQAGTFNALGAGQNYANQATNPYSVQSYMNPYIQSSLAPQLASIQRQGDITQQDEQSKATQSNAFGGSREALMAAENQRNVLNAKQQAIAQGYNTAFGQAQQAQQYGAGLGLQGAQAGIQGAGQLGQLGTSQLAAQQGIIGLQNQMGAQQQAQQQNIINNAINNYAQAQQYPEQQLAFMNAQLRGLPMQATTTQAYQAAPSPISQLGGLGATGLALSKLAKEGGVMKSYKSGGIVDLAMEKL